MITNAWIYVCLNTLACAARIGRMLDTIGKIGMSLKPHPIMSMDKTGKSHAFAAAFRLQPSFYIEEKE